MVEVELFFPLSRMVDRQATGRIRLTENIRHGELLRSLLTRLVLKYPGLQNIFDLEKQELNPFAIVIINNTIVAPHELTDATLNDGDEVSLLPQHVGGTG